MKSLLKITVICIIATGLSVPAYAETNVTQDGAGEAIVFTATAPLPSLSFIPSKNTVMAGTSTELTYSIGACTDPAKIDKDNGLQYGMNEETNGYYQAPIGTATAPALVFTNWKPMGGGSGDGGGS